MQNINTTTDTTDNEAQPTLADMIADYSARMAAKEQEQEEQLHARIEENSEHLRESLKGFLSPGLFAALDFYFGGSVRHPRSDIAEAYFKVNGVGWSIYLDEEWTIRGEQDYTRCPWPLDDDAVLSAIAEYPAWLARQQENERRMREPRVYAEIISAIPGSSFLHRHARICVNYARYYGEDGAALWGTITDWSKQFLLLTMDEGKQMLLNWQHIESIEPLYPKREKPKGKRPHHYYHNVFSVGTTEQPQPDDDMTRDEIPF